jgi:hypothetical protein
VFSVRYKLNIDMQYILTLVFTLNWFFDSLSPQRPELDSGPVFVSLVVEKMALGEVCLRALRFSPVSAIPLILPAHICL